MLPLQSPIWKELNNTYTYTGYLYPQRYDMTDFSMGNVEYLTCNLHHLYAYGTEKTTSMVSLNTNNNFPLTLLIWLIFMVQIISCSRHDKYNK